MSEYSVLRNKDAKIAKLIGKEVKVLPGCKKHDWMYLPRYSSSLDDFREIEKFIIDNGLREKFVDAATLRFDKYFFMHVSSEELVDFCIEFLSKEVNVQEYQITGFKDGIITISTPTGDVEVSAQLAANAQSLLNGCRLASDVASNVVRLVERHGEAASNPHTGIGAGWDECALECYAAMSFASEVRKAIAAAEL